jgi:hypothetical protein
VGGYEGIGEGDEPGAFRSEFGDLLEDGVAVQVRTRLDGAAQDGAVMRIGVDNEERANRVTVGLFKLASGLVTASDAYIPCLLVCPTHLLGGRLSNGQLRRKARVAAAIGVRTVAISFVDARFPPLPSRSPPTLC